MHGAARRLGKELRSSRERIEGSADAAPTTDSLPLGTLWCRRFRIACCRAAHHRSFITIFCAQWERGPTTPRMIKSAAQYHTDYEADKIGAEEEDALTPTGGSTTHHSINSQWLKRGALTLLQEMYTLVKLME